MGGMVDQVVKTEYLRQLDAATRNRAQYDMTQVVADFDPRSGLSLIDLVVKYKVALNDTQRAHVVDHWLTTDVGSTGWFQNPKNLDVLRRGMWELVKLVRDFNLPVDSYWVCYPQSISKQDIPIQLYMSLGQTQITLFIVTPFPIPSGALGNSEPTIWVTSVEKDQQGVDSVTFRNAQF